MKPLLVCALMMSSLLLLGCEDDEGTKPSDPIPNTRMILVTGGTFQMGGPGPGEMPTHTVTVSSFYLDEKEVTVADYRLFCNATGTAFPPSPGWVSADNDPIDHVTWNDASAYAKWVGRRLPTEAEWEYAARGGNQSRHYAFSGSNTLDSVAWFGLNSGGRSHPVGTKKPNELGSYDMNGNVHEWCTDWYDSSFYSVSPSVNPKGPATGTYRVSRGSDYYEYGVQTYQWHASVNRFSYRHWALPWVSGTGDGLRCAKDAM